MIKSTTTITIPFNDLDPMNIVWHGNYVKYLEQARCELFQNINYTYMDMYKDNYMYPVAKMDLKFIKPATFNQKIEVECTLEEVEPAIIISYEIKDVETGEKIFKAKSTQIAVLADSKASVYNAPKNLIKRIEEYKNV